MAKRKSTPKLAFFQKIQKYTPELMICLGVFALTVSIVHRQLYNRSLRLNAELLAQAQQQQLEETQRQQATPVHLQIGTYLNIGIESGTVQNNVWSVSPTQATYWSESGLPGFGGNIVIYGHNTRSILGPLRWVPKGEMIVLTTTAGEKVEYQITEIHEVNPNQVEFLQPTDEETVTVYTCSGFLDSKRYIVRAQRLGQPNE